MAADHSDLNRLALVDVSSVFDDILLMHRNVSFFVLPSDQSLMLIFMFHLHFPVFFLLFAFLH